MPVARLQPYRGTTTPRMPDFTTRLKGYSSPRASSIQLYAKLSSRIRLLLVSTLVWAIDFGGTQAGRGCGVYGTMELLPSSPNARARTNDVLYAMCDIGHFSRPLGRPEDPPEPPSMESLIGR
ncbi:hypothetical protein LTR22_004123 [Elasticomyces elasticus]|nr:hypothetical protein LTR22_004123 [Elasticomyces elasticus]